MTVRFPVLARARRALAVLVLAVGVASAAGPAFATPPAQQREKEQRQAEIRRQIASLREQAEDAGEEEAELLGRLEAVKDHREDLDKRVGVLDAQIRNVEREVETAQVELDRFHGRLVQARLRVSAVDARMREARATLRERAVSAYVGHPVAQAADVLLQARSMREVAAASGYLETIVEGHKAAVERYTALRKDAEHVWAELEDTKDKAKAQRDLVLSRRAQLETARAEQEQLRQQVLAEEHVQVALLEQVQARKRDFDARIGQLRGESESLSSLLRGVQTGQLAAPSGGGVLNPPVPGARLSSVFGPRVHPIFGTTRMHEGVDYAAGHGTPIRAAADGLVVHAGPRGGYGNAVVLDHGNSLGTLYAHQSSVAVSVGDRVARGQLIGYVGSTGFSTGPHLHFEVRAGGVPVNPLSYL